VPTEGQRAWFGGVVIASIDLMAITAIIFLTALAVAILILVCSTALFFFYLLVTVQRILRSKR
jgi:hypothetical protein